MRTTLVHSFPISLVALAVAACDSAPSQPADPSGSAAPADSATARVLTERDVFELMLETDAFEKARKLGTLLPTLGPESLPAVQDAIQRAADLEMGVADYELFMRFWAMHEPAEATAYAIMAAPRFYQLPAIHATLRLWASRDPHEALAQSAASTMIGGDVGSTAEIAVVRGWFDSGQPGLVEYIHDLGATFDRQRALRVYTLEMVRQKGADELVRWAESLPETDQQFRLEAFRLAGQALATYDTEAAVRFCDRHCGEEYADSVRSYIVHRWSRHDPAAALEWLSTAPASRDRDIALGPAFADWGRRDRATAVAWLRAQTADGIPAWLQPIVTNGSRLIAEESSYPAALEWVAQIEDPEEREPHSIRLARSWRQVDEEAAEAWIAESDLSEEALAKVRGPAPPRRGPESR
jgi:hypothetical protein